jgi:hypothetical protein
MTEEQEFTLGHLYRVCNICWKDSADIAAYERKKRIVISMNLTADEYEEAVREIAGIIGV